MLQIAYHPAYVYPLPEGHRFPMLKYELIPQQLLYEGLISKDNLFLPEVWTDEETILLTHEAGYWKRLRDLALTPAEIRRIGFPMTRALVERELRIIRGTIEGCLLARKYGVAFNVA